MKPAREFELPEECIPVLRRAIVLEWSTIAFLISVTVLMYLVMGHSQAMKTAWIEDVLSLIPPAAFLVSTRVRRRPPNERFPYGYHRVVTIAFLISAVALTTMGMLLLADSGMKLIKAEHPTIGGVRIFGHVIWLGWLMIPVLLYSVIPAVVLGRLKHRPAHELHDKTLYADAMMNKADWETGLAAMIGIIGIGMGWWWLDPLAAMFISFSIAHDGWKHLNAAITDLMDRVPQTVDERAEEGLPQRLAGVFEALPWVRRAKVRLRENGHVFFGEAFVVPRDSRDLIRRADQLRELSYRTDWRINELTVEFVAESDEERRTLTLNGDGT